jgi:hypothetical protein|tara:strand:+ start:851 stop:1108 length:258 start_codon:yes stop_codon:yes gene_type:complete
MTESIRFLYCDIESEFSAAKADGDKIEIKHWRERMDTLLQKMTPEQRSWCLDEHDQIPSETFAAMMLKIKEQEKQGGSNENQGNL